MEAEKRGIKKMPATPTMLMKTKANKNRPGAYPTMLMKTNDLQVLTYDVDENKRVSFNRRTNGNLEHGNPNRRESESQASKILPFRGTILIPIPQTGNRGKGLDDVSMEEGNIPHGYSRSDTHC